MKLPTAFACLALWLTVSALADDSPVELTSDVIHLRSGSLDGPAEWSEFEGSTPVAEWTHEFEWPGSDLACLEVHQRDVKQDWRIHINGKEVGKLIRDENPLLFYVPLSKDDLKQGKNTIRVFSNSKEIDDITMGPVVLHPTSSTTLLSECVVELNVSEWDGPAPCRITIAAWCGDLQQVESFSDSTLAVRPGVIYSGTGKAKFGLPPGLYEIYAGRGFEYSVAREIVQVRAGTNELNLTIQREVPTEGYVACDTHVHTLTYSGHGDSSIQERMLTLAGEGIELPIATDHNKQIDYRATAAEMGVSSYFTPVVGNEVTTKLGHFNVFPLTPGEAIPNFKLTDWDEIQNEIARQPESKIVILNHARDIHSGVRPFGPLLFNDSIGERYDGQPLRINAMEILNSGAIQSDPLELTRDWMQLLNRGLNVTPIGCSDSHDVSRYIVGQGRTYIRCDDSDPANIPVDEAINNLLQGRVTVSYGLLTELTVNDKYSPGETATAPDDTIHVGLRVLGPHWVIPRELHLYANGELIKEFPLPSEPMKPGVKYEGELTIPRPAHDVHLVAVAFGNGLDNYWPTAKPYQPTTPNFESTTLGVTGAVRVDADRDGRWSSARDYAERLISQHGDSLANLLKACDAFDTPTATHAYHLWHIEQEKVDEAAVTKLLENAAEHVKLGVYRYRDALRAHEIALIEAN
ncbi:MAG: CehA/McbA family metallohydrolase [Planctomycetaceae bacterium]|nr:CehA/McbA family metallohydrolase [Planctomycetaceae bacterium]MCB9950877.1 CehA/McbA family metallohydrolase [Planctomycetaceae bacterium]